MYLKSIEVQGFKSFANKIKFEFHNGITAIVGPNGSGKSNVADAIRWVFGEQSAKQLRGASMQDVIFAGTQLRRPQSFASVSITLDNSDRALALDYDEVTVTRKLYRSGESEYLINNSITRLKDVQELFYDTGIGKEGYSVIGQGQVDKILSGRPEDRRELFDEACGLIKFKQRKKTAVRKLENERANMVRIADIVSELERQAGPLKRQSETAREYLKLRDELKTYDINAFLINHEQHAAQLKEAEGKLADLNRELETKQQEEEILRSKHDELEAEVQALDSRLEQLHETVNAASEDKASREGELKLKSEQRRTSEENRKRLEDRVASIDREWDEKQKEEEELRNLKEEKLKEADELRSQYEKEASELEKLNIRISSRRQVVDEKRKGIIDLLNEKSETGSRLSALKTLLEQNRLRKEEAAGERKNIEEEYNTVYSEKDKAENELKELQDNQVKLSKEAVRLREELNTAESDLDRARLTVNELSRDLQIAKGRHDTLRSMQEQYEGFNNAVRSVMSVRNRYKGVCGVISDLIEVDEKYRTAVEAALGGNYQNVVVETESTAKNLIAHLKETRSGRATFLPLESMRPSGRIDSRVFDEPGVLGSGDSIVSYEAKYDKAIRFLLGRFVVCDTINNALLLARKYGYSLRIVTLEGELLSPGGSMSGGSMKHNNSFLSRNSEIRELEERTEALKRGIEENEKKVGLLTQLRESSSLEYEDVQEELSANNVSLAEKKALYDSLSRQLTALELEKKETDSRLKELQQEEEKAFVEKTAIEENVKVLENAGKSADNETEENEKLLASETEEAENYRRKTEELRLKLNDVTLTAQHTDENLNRLNSEGLKLLEERKKTAEEAEVLEEEIRTADEEIRKLDSEFKASSEHLKGLQETLDLLAKERNNMTESRRDYFDKRDALSSILTELGREQVRLQSQAEKAEEHLDSEAEYLWSEYQLTPSEAEKFRDDTLENPSYIRRHTQELKSSIRSLGNVNVNAIEQYAEVSERYEFLTGQYNDLKSAEESMETFINELDDGMRRQFNEQFARIRDEYDKVFKELFGGGQGTLQLKDGDVIEADISVISQPPGKKLQNMMQLSGGEKALSAIALIFAIQNLKPSPFCLLDEIEAALDDSNVGRFTGYLRRLTHSTQFILITHRRGSMVAADRLYGITMQEKGVSTLVSVNLVEQELDN